MLSGLQQEVDAIISSHEEAGNRTFNLHADLDSFLTTPEISALCAKDPHGHVAESVRKVSKILTESVLQILEAMNSAKNGLDFLHSEIQSFDGYLMEKADTIGVAPRLAQQYSSQGPVPPTAAASAFRQDPSQIKVLGDIPSLSPPKSPSVPTHRTARFVAPSAGQETSNMVVAVTLSLGPQLRGVASPPPTLKLRPMLEGINDLLLEKFTNKDGKPLTCANGIQAGLISLVTTRHVFTVVEDSRSFDPLPQQASPVRDWSMGAPSMLQQPSLLPATFGYNPFSMLPLDTRLLAASSFPSSRQPSPYSPSPAFPQVEDSGMGFTTIGLCGLVTTLVAEFEQSTQIGDSTQHPPKGAFVVRGDKAAEASAMAEKLRAIFSDDATADGGVLTIINLIDNLIPQNISPKLPKLIVCTDEHIAGNMIDPTTLSLLVWDGYKSTHSAYLSAFPNLNNVVLRGAPAEVRGARSFKLCSFEVVVQVKKSREIAVETFDLVDSTFGDVVRRCQERPHPTATSSTMLPNQQHHQAHHYPPSLPGNGGVTINGNPPQQQPIGPPFTVVTTDKPLTAVQVKSQGSNNVFYVTSLATLDAELFELADRFEKCRGMIDNIVVVGCLQDMRNIASHATAGKVTLVVPNKYFKEREFAEAIEGVTGTPSNMTVNGCYLRDGVAYKPLLGSLTRSVTGVQY